MPGIRVDAYAKVNLGLAVRSRRTDGYHDIETVFQSVDLSDTLWLEPSSGSETTLAVTGLPAPEGPTNLAWRAAERMIAAFGCPPVKLRIEKRIPIAAGLGGGSADAAAVLAGMNRLYRLDAGEDRLRELALAIGSDVPFMLKGGTARGWGRGELLEPLPTPGWIAMVLVTPDVPVSAASAYAAAKIGLTDNVSFIRVNCSAIQEGDFDRLAAALRNDLEAEVVSACPEIAVIRTALLREGAAAAVMSGSGPTVIGVVHDRSEGDSIASRLTERGWAVHVVAPIGVGLCLADM